MGIDEGLNENVRHAQQPGPDSSRHALDQRQWQWRLEGAAYEPAGVAVAAALSGGLRFVNLAMQPASPQAAGTLDGVAFVGLPGAPVSALVSFAVFALPVLRILRGLDPVHPVRRVELAAPVDPHPVKTRYVCARWAPDGDRRRVVPYHRHGSHLIAALADTDPLLEIAPWTQGHAAGPSSRHGTWTEPGSRKVRTTSCADEPSCLSVRLQRLSPSEGNAR